MSGTVGSGRQDMSAASQDGIHTVPEVLTLAEVADLLRCSKAHMCNVINGKVPCLPPLPFMSLGRRKLIRRTVLEEWMESLEQR